MLCVGWHLARIATSLALPVLIVGAAATPARAAAPASQALAASPALPVQSRCQVAGPYATIRRANEIAAEARRRGYNAIVYHNGDGYYVRAC